MMQPTLVVGDDRGDKKGGRACHKFPYCLLIVYQCICEVTRGRCVLCRALAVCSWCTCIPAHTRRILLPSLTRGRRVLLRVIMPKP
jgi:hypothetical protein